MTTLESSETRPSSGSVHEKKTEAVEIDGRDTVLSVAFFADGKHIVGGGRDQMIRCWRVTDGEQVGPQMGAGAWVSNIAVSRNGKWIVSGMTLGLVQVWNAENGKKLTEFEHGNSVRVVDVSPDSTKIATGLNDKTICVWSLPTGRRLLGPWGHQADVVAVKFSPDGHFVATVTWARSSWSSSLRVYGSGDRFLVNIPIKVTNSSNQSLVWRCNNQQLFALSHGNIYCINASTGATLSRWSIRSNEVIRLSLSSNGTFIAVSDRSSVSFWDITTHKQVGSVIQYSGGIKCMAISANYDIAIGSGSKITLRSLCDILPASYVSTFASTLTSPSSNHLVDHRSFHKDSGKQRLVSGREVSCFVCWMTLAHFLICISRSRKNGQSGECQRTNVRTTCSV